MTTTKHTPTPWSTFGSVVKAKLTTVACAELKPDEYFDMPLAEANAAHIVACVNSHDALAARVAELEEVLHRAFIALGKHGCNMTGSIGREEWLAARAALKGAK
jgi:hypothetical protein